MSTHNIGFYEDLTKLSLNYHQISSNTHLISSAAGPICPKTMVENNRKSLKTKQLPIVLNYNFLESWLVA